MKNSVKVDAVVVYTGLDSKLAMNVQKPRTKKSRSQKIINLLIIADFIVLIVAVGIYYAGSFKFINNNSKCQIKEGDQAFGNTCLSICTYDVLKD